MVSESVDGLDPSLHLAVAYAVANLHGDSNHAVFSPVRAPGVLEHPDGVASWHNDILAWLPVAFSAWLPVAFGAWLPVALFAWDAALALISRQNSDATVATVSSALSPL